MTRTKVSKQMDELDSKLLDMLEQHGYQKTSVLARNLDSSEPTIRRRVNRMKNEGIIKIVAFTNPLLVKPTSLGEIGIKVQPKFIHEIARKLVDYPQIYFVAYSHGEFDIMTSARFDSTDRLASFANSELTKIRGITAIETMQLICLRKYHEFYWPPPPSLQSDSEWEHYRISISSRRNKLDNIDRAILDILMQDGLARPATITTRLGLAESTIRIRLKKMSSNEFFKISVVPNPLLLQSEVWSLVGITIRDRPAHKIIDNVLKNSVVYHASECLGRFNVLLSCRLRNMDLFNQFIREKLLAIDGITSVTPFLFDKPLKYHGITWSL